MSNTLNPGAHTQSKADSEHGEWTWLLFNGFEYKDN